MTLTDVQVRTAQVRDKTYRMSDTGGMYFWVAPSGGKLWRWAYTFERKEKLISLGRYPEVSLYGPRASRSSAQATCDWR